MQYQLPKSAGTYAPANLTALERADFWAKRGCIPQARAEYAQALFEDEPAARAAFGVFLRDLGDRRGAAEQFRQLLELSRRRNDHRLRAIACNNLAVLERETGQPDLALTLQQRSYESELHNQLDGESSAEVACDLSNMANDILLRGDRGSASRLLRSALLLDIVHNDDLLAQAADWGSLGLVHLLEGRFDEARSCLKKSFRLHRRMDDCRGIGCNLLHIGQTWAAQGDWPRAEKAIGKAVQILRKVPDGELRGVAESIWEQVHRRRRVRECDPLCN